jgi:hypothetical protein
MTEPHYQAVAGLMAFMNQLPLVLKGRLSSIV